MTQNWRFGDKKGVSDETLEGHKLKMAAVSTKQTEDIIASAAAVQFPAS